MGDSIITVENLGKKYRISHQGNRQSYTALRDVIAEKAKRLVRFKKRRPLSGNPKIEEFWALQGISFGVKEGEIVGIVGRNGAGKSTLLKVLSRITEPTTGRITLRGRVGSLLEVGTGFHPELTGRENIFLNGAILGMRKTDINKHFDAIVEFAEVEKFLDTPVKRYSSGMYVRLAFAVAAHMEPEILIVDEVLAVGDAQFQKKCLGKMGEVAKAGRTVLFVSHNMGVMAQLCQKGVLLESGHVAKTGGIDEVIQGYLASGSNARSNRFISKPSADKFTVHILEAETVGEDREGAVEFGHDEPIRLGISCALNCRDLETLNSIRLTACVVDGMGRRVFASQTGIGSAYASQDSFKAVMRIPPGVLTPGTYHFIINANIPPTEVLHRVEEVCAFEVLDLGTEFAMMKSGGYGCVFVKCDWSIAPNSLESASVYEHALT